MILPDDTPPSPSKVRPSQLPVDRSEPQAQAPPPAYPGYSSYQANQPLYGEPSTLPLHTRRERVKSARRRFLQAFAFAVLIYFLVGTFISSLFGLSRHGRELEDYLPSGPKPEDGRQERCVKSVQDWERVGNGYIMTSFGLPLSADALYLFTRGSLSAGTITVMSDRNLNNKSDMIVDIVASPFDSTHLNILTICSLEKGPGQRGIGIFTPQRLRLNRGAKFHLAITLRIPSSSSREPLHIQSLETSVHDFLIRMTDLVPTVLFDSLSLRTTNSAIIAKGGLSAENATLQTSNAAIDGVFTTSSSLELITTNHPIEATVTMFNLDYSIPTRLWIKTTNGHLGSSIYLLSNDGRGGNFDVVAETTNDPLSITFPTQPIDSALHLQARTKNSLASVNLHRSFEGDFSVRSTNARQIVEADENAEDPDNNRRGKRHVEMKKSRNVIDGSVVWLGDGDTPRAGKGRVDVRTTNGPAMLRLM
ncbi:unnamed protein product [Somion occarium]|uniref:Adhesin domain-containing protein n=1 Tax=Somion occarium TaxID=3059160 RepID=A0ABP1DVB0_9APHY